jgi:hypothetical protein
MWGRYICQEETKQDRKEKVQKQEEKKENANKDY